MSIAQRLVNLSDGLSADGVLSAAKGGTGGTTGGGTTSPTVSQISYLGNDTAASPAGGTTITLTGTNFASGAKVLINNTQVGVVTVVSATQITFTAPALAAGSYILYVVNLDGSTAIAVPGIQYSGVPAWSTAAGSLGTTYETGAVSATLSATSDSAVTYSVFSGTLPSGATLNSNGTISGTSPLVSGSTTYTFTVRATDAENQDTDRSFSLTVNPDVVSWSSPANGATLTGAPGSAYSSNLLATSAAGSSVSYSANSLPAGLSISGSTITGTPTTAGTSTTTLTATAATTSKTAQITINWTISVAADAYFASNTLLLNAETTAVPFTTDASANNFAVTAFGDTKPNNFNPYTPGYYSNYFDGTGDYLSIPASSALSFAADFTIECWVNTSTTSLDPYGRRLWSFGSGASFYLDALFYDGGSTTSNICIEIASIGIVITGTIPVADGRWHHVALSRSGSSMKLFVDGVQSGSTYTTSSAFTAGATNGMFLGCVGAGVGGFLLGSISNFRVNNTTGLYTTTFTPSTIPLTDVSGTGLLTCQSNRFIDSSTNAATVTRNGDTKISGSAPFVPNTSYATYGSAYFDGTGDYATVASNSALAMGTGQYTVEFWIYFNSLSSQPNELFRTSTDSSSGRLTIYYNSGSLQLTATGGAGATSASYTFNTNQWYHVAGSRDSSNNQRLFVNGVLLATTTSTNDYSQSGITIGRDQAGTNYLNGYISNFRLVKGTAVYTSAFTPSAAPLTAITNTSLLTLQTNQPNTNSVFLDNSTNALAITRNGNATQGSFSPYGANWSNYFDGSGDFLATPTALNAAMGTGFAGNIISFECWIYPLNFNSGSYDQFITSAYAAVAANGRWGIVATKTANATTTLGFAYTTGTASQNNVTSTAAAINLNQWNHIAVTIDATTAASSTIKLFANGQLLNTFTAQNMSSQTSYYNSPLIGGANSAYASEFNGYISNYRILKGALAYTGNYTVPTEPLTVTPQTVLLTCQSPNFTDNSPNAYAITKTGDVSVQKFSPFATVTQTPKTYSTYFDGSGDYLSIPTSTALNLATGDFTIEAWVYVTSTANSDQTILSSNQSWGSGAVVLKAYHGGNISFTAYDNSSGGTAMVSYATALNTWTHVALVRSGTTFTLYVNGVSRSTATSSINVNFGPAGGTYIGYAGPINSTTGYLYGYISNLRVVKGTAVYTSAFTPPTTPLTAVAGTSLLTCQSPTIIDNSTNAFAISTFGDARARRQNPFGVTISSAQDYSPQVLGASGYFDGTGDYLGFANSYLPNIAGTEFTLEFWVYSTKAQSGSSALISSGNIELNLDSGTPGQIRFDLPTGVANVLNSGSNVVIPNTWNHIALTRTSGNAYALYLNGVNVGTGSSSTAITTLSTFGYNSTRYLQGYISDLRVTNSVVYTGGFVPPQAPLSAVQNTTLLLNMDKAAISDKSGKVNLETVGDTNLSTAVKKYGSASLYFDGTGDYLALAPNPQYAFGGGDFTIECWVNSADVSNAQRGFLQTSATAGGFQTTYTSGITFLFGAAVSGGNAVSLSGGIVSNIAGTYIGSSTSVITANTWTHVALVRINGTAYMYVNGSQVGSSAAAGNCTGTNLVVGGYYSTSYLYNGYLDDLRISRYARYTANFTPPTSALLIK